MESLARIVDESLARHGLVVSIDHRRLKWSRWFHCESSFSLLLVPSTAGIYALGEEVIAPGQVPAVVGKRMLAVFHIGETEDLCLALSGHFAPRSAFSERLSSGLCFVRFAEIADAVQRHSAGESLARWLTATAETPTGRARDFAADAEPAPQLELMHSPSLRPTKSDDDSSEPPPKSNPPPFPAGF